MSNIGVTLWALAPENVIEPPPSPGGDVLITLLHLECTIETF